MINQADTSHQAGSEESEFEQSRIEGGNTPARFREKTESPQDEATRHILEKRQTEMRDDAGKIAQTPELQNAFIEMCHKKEIRWNRSEKGSGFYHFIKLHFDMDPTGKLPGVKIYTSARRAIVVPLLLATKFFAKFTADEDKNRALEISGLTTEIRDFKDAEEVIRAMKKYVDSPVKRTAQKNQRVTEDSNHWSGGDYGKINAST